MKQKTTGLTLVEILVSLGILAIILAAFSGSVVSNMKQNSSSGSRTSAVRILDYVGRLVVEGNSNVLPTSGYTSRTWNYNQLTTLPGLTAEDGIANPNLYKATVTNSTTPSWSTDLSLNLISYDVQICWRNSGNESCVATKAVGPGNPSLATGADVN
jgi:type II secretory pathway pseudopilin PulG